MFLKIATFVLIPSLIIQGRQVKKNTPRLAEPEGMREGQTGQGPVLSILIVGDSAAAGVGVATQDDALLGALIKELQMDYALQWKLHARSGDGTVQIINNLHTLDDQPYDVVLTSVGVNDVTQLMSAQQWIKKQKQLYALIHQKFTPKMVIATGVPPMHLFPALPNPLRWLFGQYAMQMNMKLAKFVQQQSNMQSIEYNIKQYQSLNLNMAEDGFHPSKVVYQLWAKEVADKIRQSF